MKEIMEIIAKELVEHTDKVVVTEEVRDNAIVFKLSVDKSDMGRVIGRGGRIANSIRKVMEVAAWHIGETKKVIVDIG